MTFKKGDIVQLVQSGSWHNDLGVADGAKGQYAEFIDYTGNTYNDNNTIHIKLLALRPGQHSSIVLTSEERIKKI